MTDDTSTSNKAQTLAITSCGYFSCPSEPSPFVDRLSIVVTPVEDDEDNIYKAIFTSLDDPSLFQDAAHCKWGPFRIAKRFNLGASSNPLFQVAYAGKRVTKLRMEFNPNALGSDRIAKLKADCMCLMPDGWEYVLKLGRITRLDVAVDFYGVLPSSFAVLPQQGLTSRMWSVDGKLQTLVLGKKPGNQTILYDKSAEIVARGLKWNGPPVARLERRLNKPSITILPQLASLKNPFSGLVLSTLTTCPPPTSMKSGEWEMFKDSAVMRGLPGALQLLSVPKRTACRKHISAHPHAVWDPQSIWAKWGQAVAASALSTAN